MSYQVLARKWRPQRFEDVIGQRGVTQTLRNAIAGGRVAQSFVFSGPRGVGKTTTARILARALNCQNGPTPDPCGTCDACVEIAEGRDIDVFEIDAATHTQVDKVREIIIAGLGMAPVRDRYKIFIIDEVHRLSQAAFDALLKSIEEPPPHVVFMMATTELEKVPATIQSRSQVFELKTIGLKQIADQLRRIADAEKIDVDEAALTLVARAGDGSMRDAQSALDQVIGFAGTTITAEDVTTVLGLVRRDLLVEMADAVAREDATVVFDLATRAVESGYDLRLVIRELARLTRDLLVLTIDPSRAGDPEIAGDGEREALLDLARRFSGEDLMRAFDVLTKAETDIRASTQPRYHLEMALLRWIHLRKLVPLTTLIEQMQGGARAPVRLKPDTTAPRPPQPQTKAATVGAIEARRSSGSGNGTQAPEPAPSKPSATAAGEAGPVSPKPLVTTGGEGGLVSPKPLVTTEGGLVSPKPLGTTGGEGGLKDSFLAEIRRSKKFFHGAVVAQAQRIDLEADRFVFVYAPQHRALRSQLEQNRPWLEATASELAGRRMTVVSAEAGSTGTPTSQPPAQPSSSPNRQQALKEQALADAGVQALLDVFAAEIKDVEEM